MVPGEGLGRGTDSQVGRQAWRGPQSRPRLPQDPLACSQVGRQAWRGLPRTPRPTGQARGKARQRGRCYGTCFTCKLFPKWQECSVFQKSLQGKHSQLRLSAGTDTLPHRQAPQPRRLQRFNESEAATPISASLQKLSAFLGAETSPVTLPWLMQTRTQDWLSKMLQGLLLEASFRCHFPEHLTINVCVLKNDDMLFSKSPGSSTQPTLKGGAGTFCPECLAMGGASERLCTSRKTGDNLITLQAA